MCKFFQDTVKIFGSQKAKRKQEASRQRMRFTLLRDRTEAVRYANTVGGNA